MAEVESPRSLSAGHAATSRPGPPRCPAQRAVAKRFAREYFDGERGQGYGGYRYDGRWVADRGAHPRPLRAPGRRSRPRRRAAPRASCSTTCARWSPGLRVAGLDISAYALGHAMDDVRPFLVRGSAERLPFADGAFDLVVSINTLHNLDRADCIRALGEIERVSRGHRYVQVDSWLDETQREKFERWQLTALTYSDPEGWRRLFARGRLHRRLLLDGDRVTERPGGRLMKIFVDSANLVEIEEALERGFPAGITTNPSILAKEEKGGLPRAHQEDHRARAALRLRHPAERRGLLDPAGGDDRARPRTSCATSATIRTST